MWLRCADKTIPERPDALTCPAGRSRFLPTLPAEDPGSLGVGDFLRLIAENPFGGSKTIIVEGSTGTVAWGLGIGSWLLLASAVMLFVAGALALTTKYPFLPQWYVDGLANPEEAAQKAGEGDQAPP